MQRGKVASRNKDTWRESEKERVYKRTNEGGKVENTERRGKARERERGAVWLKTPDRVGVDCRSIKGE